MKWTDYLKEAERGTLYVMEMNRRRDGKIRRRIYDRCRKRMARALASERPTP